MNAKIVILANKWWEVTPLVSVLQHSRSIKPDFSSSPSDLEILESSVPQQACKRARLVLKANQELVEVWCMEDLIPQSKNSSSSFEKQKALCEFKSRQLSPVALLIAFGTAAAPKSDFAGNVVVGCNVFVNDAATTEGDSESANHRQFGQKVDSATGERIENQDIQSCFVDAEKRFLSPPNNPSANLKIFADPTFVSVGVVNVANNQDYAKVDQDALYQFAKLDTGDETLSVETTHGLIRLCNDNPFLYVSGIANTVGAFNEQVKSRQYAQNFAASHNAAVCLAWMLPTLCKLIGAKG